MDQLVHAQHGSGIRPTIVLISLGFCHIFFLLFVASVFSHPPPPSSILLFGALRLLLRFSSPRWSRRRPWRRRRNKGMALSPLDSWTRDYGEACKLADDLAAIVAERASSSSSSSGGGAPNDPEARRQAPALRRKITILGARLDGLDSLLSKLSTLQQPPTEKELLKRRDTLANLRAKMKQMAAALNMSNLANREDLLGQGRKPVDEISRTEGLDNRGIVTLQRQIMKGMLHLPAGSYDISFSKQDEGLVKLEETVLSTKHIALAVNEELDLHTRLIDTLEDHVDSTNSRLQRVQQKLAILNKRTKGGCSCTCLLIAVVIIVILAAVVWALVKYL
ncbi:hypothetical protein Taro_004629 [Colocasia esculenta]|uniref:t-SNARE coiled-coil homology domain-containing protein n=1 Tax=Colocasia esculenta TaxID=4460 RepID=A0A843TIP5_COLES|nr:hypothetical protein [Colocasia esculenta]